jgi:2-polyprenyl-3-methyl-5-hydroxy-6-metoxy-1,4-benzoquinol methylase
MAEYNTDFIEWVSTLKKDVTEDRVILPNGKECFSSSLTDSNGLFELEDHEWKQFWKDCKHYFPFHSVHGNSGQTKEYIVTREREHLDIYLSRLGVRINDLYNKRILEIGYGYGGLGLELMEKYNSEYYGIDYVASDKELLSKHNNACERCFLEIDKSGIPDSLKVKKFDFVMAFNVFQHLTQKQRFEYIRQAYDCLNDGGYLIFEVFSYNWQCGKKRWDKWRTYFFNVSTYIDYEKEIQSYIRKVGFKIKKQNKLYKLNDTTFTKLYLCKK